MKGLCGAAGSAGLRQASSPSIVLFAGGAGDGVLAPEDAEASRRSGLPPEEAVSYAPSESIGATSTCETTHAFNIVNVRRILGCWELVDPGRIDGSAAGREIKAGTRALASTEHWSLEPHMREVIQLALRYLSGRSLTVREDSRL